MVASLGEGEANRAAGAAVNHLVLHPVVSCRAAWLVADRPAEDSPPTVAHQDLTVVLGDGKGRDLGWVSVVLAIKRRVHGEFAPEDQLALPSVACPELVIRPCVHGGGLERLRHQAMAWMSRMSRMSRMRVRDLSLALRVVDKHEAVLFINAKGV